MVSIARKNLFHDKGRFAITLIGLASSLVLILFGLGMFTGTLSEMLSIIDRTHADIWIVQAPNQNIVDPSVISGKIIARIKKIAGVERAHELVNVASKIEKGDRQLNITLVGFDLDNKMGLPWNLVSGAPDNLQNKDSIITDQSIEVEFGDISIGNKVSASDTSQKIVGMTKDAKSFIYPFVFTSLENARRLAGLKSDETSFVLVEIERGHGVPEVVRELSKIDGINAFSTEQVRKNTSDYMIFKSGMGMGTLIMALVGAFVAAVIIALTVYTATMERIPEFGTLKAIGASKRDIYQILLEQVFISVTIGYLIGAILSILLAIAVSKVILMPIYITHATLIVAYFSMLVLSTLGAFFSIRRVHRIDPAIVFRA